MKRTAILILLLFFVSVPALAQDRWGTKLYRNDQEIRNSKFQEGYITPRSGETLEGKISLKKVDGKLVEYEGSAAYGFVSQRDVAGMADRKGTDRMKVGQSLADRAAQSAAVHGAEQSLERGDSMMTAASNAAEAGANTVEALEDLGNTEIMNKEYIVRHARPDGSLEEYVVYDGNTREVLQPFLQGCGTYGAMSKSEQKALASFDRVGQAVQLLDDCFAR